jgi:two-component system, NarL family, sensor histidine kinase UhpB
MKLPSPFSLRTIEHPLFSRRPVAVSTLWRVFTVNALVFGTAVFILIVSPATIHYHIRFTELMVLVLGLVATLAIDLVLLSLVLSPLRKLAALMGDIDPMRPGQRAPAGSWASSETIALSNALNTMLDRLETERRESARRALAAQEAERLRVARELHDEVGQTLTAVALQAERVAGDFPSQALSLHEIVDTIHHSLDDVRRIVRELRPEALDDLGLTDALISLCLRMEQQGAITVRRELESGLPALSSEVELVIYRVAQEALTNALRHSQATEVRVALRRADPVRLDDSVTLGVTDDGRGLPEALESQTGGLAGMRERSILIGADIEIGPSADGGVEVCLTVASNPESA